MPVVAIVRMPITLRVIEILPMINCLAVLIVRVVGCHDRRSPFEAR
jgi:hypothetical protein